jgi:MoxR-like ATPase
MTEPARVYETLRDEMQTVLIGHDTVIEQLTISLLTDGHVLLEGVPGVAKTTAAKLFAAVTGLDYSRVQMTPDVLPADVTGTHIYHEATGEFTLQRGPVFANLLLADEINRATPKTQSALLEAMQEHTVTIEGETLELPSPFMVIATQNPIEMEGTFELPEAQRDRFQFKLTIDLPERAEESALLDRFSDAPELGPESAEQVLTPEDLLEARKTAQSVHIERPIKEYILDLVGATREHPDVAYGGSPRATLGLLHTSRAQAAIRGRDYVIPDDVKALVVPILRHRLVLTTEADLSQVAVEDVIDDVLESVEAPGSSPTTEEEEAIPGNGGSPPE